jgi:hypothetical protein
MSVADLVFWLLLLPNGHEIRLCRGHCAEHAAEVAHAIEEASIAHGIDALELVAVGFRESSLLARESATGKGFFGWHPRARLWRECSAPCGVEEQADITARELVGLKGVCGSTFGALSAWQSGRCDSVSGDRYARRVLRVLSKLRARAPRRDVVPRPYDSCGAPCMAAVAHPRGGRTPLAGGDGTYRGAP